MITWIPYLVGPVTAIGETVCNIYQSVYFVWSDEIDSNYMSQYQCHPVFYFMDSDSKMIYL